MVLKFLTSSAVDTCVRAVQTVMEPGRRLQQAVKAHGRALCDCSTGVMLAPLADSGNKTIWQLSPAGPCALKKSAVCYAAASHIGHR